jgi:hypothetical protein
MRWGLLAGNQTFVASDLSLRANLFDGFLTSFYVKGEIQPGDLPAFFGPSATWGWPYSGVVVTVSV